MRTLILAFLLGWAGAARAQPTDFLSCEQSRQPDQPAIHQALHSSDKAVRARGARAAARLGDPAYLEDLRTLLQDPDEEVRREAIFALSLVPQGVTWLRSVADPSAVLALSRDQGPEALESYLSHSSREIRQAAATALGVYALRRQRNPWLNLPPVSPEGLSQLRQAASQGSPEALYALYRLADAGSQTVVVEGLRQASSRVDYLRVLSTFPATSAEADLLALDKSPSAWERLWAARALLKLRANHPGLREWLQDPSPHVRRAILQGLQDPGPEWRSQLLQACLDREISVSEAALSALAPDEPRLLEAASSPLWQHRRAAARRIDQGLLRQLAGDPDPRVREAAWQRLPLPDCDLLQVGGDPALSAAAAERLAQLNQVQRLPELEAALGAFCLAHDSEAAQSLIEPIYRLGGRRSLEALLDSPDHNLASLAARVLHQSEPTTLSGTGPASVGALGARGERAILHTSRGEIQLRLYPEVAPYTVAQFTRLTRQDFYRQRIFHRVVSDFVIQTGCPRGDGWGGEAPLRCEVSPLPYRRGTLGMALAGKDTGSSQFFLCHSPQPHLDGNYTVFGQVEEGMEVVDQIQEGDTLLWVEVE